MGKRRCGRRRAGGAGHWQLSPRVFPPSDGLVSSVSEARRAEGCWCGGCGGASSVGRSPSQFLPPGREGEAERLEVGGCRHADVLMGSAVDNEGANGNLIRKLACHLNCLPSYPQSCQRSRTPHTPPTSVPGDLGRQGKKKRRIQSFAEILSFLSLVELVQKGTNAAPLIHSISTSLPSPSGGGRTKSRSKLGPSIIF